MKNKLFNWSYNTTSDKVLNYIKRGINNSLSDDLIHEFSIKRMLKHNIFSMFLVLVFIFSGVSFYLIGSNSRDIEVKVLTDKIRMIYTELGINHKALDWKKDDIKHLKKELNKIKNSRTYMASIVEREANIKIPERVDDEHLKLMFDQAELNDIPYKIYFRLIKKESNYKWWVTSSAGAKGYMQMVPNTYKFAALKLNLPKKMTAESNIKAGSWYLKRLYDKQFNKIIHKKVYDKLDINLNKKISDLSEEEYDIYSFECEKIKDNKSYYNYDNKKAWELALSVYNAGGSNVGYEIPNIKETKNYVKFILKPYYEI